jgi:hypothetical protein
MHAPVVTACQVGRSGFGAYGRETFNVSARRDWIGVRRIDCTR